MEFLISQIRRDQMNNICFDCGVENPTFVSVNNGIFLCNQCASIHMSFPQGVSIIENNDLYSLSENELQFLAKGGNTNLNDFILDEFPKLENYSQKLLYKTRGMDYYRQRLYYYVYGGVEPRRPSQIVACQLMPENYYRPNDHMNTHKRFEPKTRTYRPEDHIKSRKFNINKGNNENDYEEEFFRDPFMNESRFGNEGDMFKKFFGGDLFDMDDDDFFNFGGNRNMNQTQYKPSYNYQYQTNPNTGNINSYYYKNNNNNNDPRNNLSKSTHPGLYSHKVVRPMSSTNPIFVPSRKHKYIKKENQNNNFNNINNNVSQSQGNYDPFKRRDSTDLITLPGTENSNLLKNKRKVKPHEIPLEFSKQASGLGQIADAIHENDNESISSNSINDDEIENELDSSAELEKNLKENEDKTTNENNNNSNYEEDNGATFKNSIRNKYKNKKNQMETEKKKDEEKNIFKSKPNNSKNNNNNDENKSNNLGSKKSSEFKSKKSGLKNKDGANSNINMSYARKLSKMNITSTNWNINQLGEIFTYPEIIFIEE